MGNDETKDIFWANTPSKACFGLTPTQAYELCKAAFDRMELDKKDKAEKAKQGRRAAIEHTKRKNADE